MKKRVILVFLIFALIFSGANGVLAKDKQRPEINNGKYTDYADLMTGYDRWQGFNRKMFNFNLKLNRYLIRPICVVWTSVMPQAAITGIDNLFFNIDYPARLVSSALQGDFETSWSETKRFFINTTLGVAGLWDVASKPKFNIEKHDENLGQVFAHYGMPKGPYLNVPFYGEGGNIRDLGGTALNVGLKPTTYVFFGIGSWISTGVSYLNDATLIEPITVLADTYADPYQVSRQLFGLENYMKNTNMDRKAVYDELVEKQKDMIDVNYQIDNKIKADVSLENYSTQSADTDAVRTLIFDNKNVDKSIWAELSLWNRTFIKKLKISTVTPFQGRAKYKFKYVLQRNKKAPLAIIYPPIGESIWSAQAFEQGKMLYDRGFSVVILSSAFNWEFVNAVPANYTPGLPMEDAKILRTITSTIIKKLEKKHHRKFNKKILAGTSFGAMETLYTGQLEAENPELGISYYIAINPPIDAFYAMKQIDRISESNKPGLSQSQDMENSALIAQKVLKTIEQAENGTFEKDEKLPFTKKEAQIATGYSLRQKLSDVIFAIEVNKNPKIKKSEIYKIVDNTGFEDYTNNYLIPNQAKPQKSLEQEASLYYIENFLKTNNNFTIFHTTNDIFANADQLIWLKNVTGNKTILFDNGSHLGYLYRKEFLSRFANLINCVKNSGL